jgi:large repetitive protein
MKSATFRVALVGRIACVVIVLAAVLSGCSGETAGSGTQEDAKAASGAPPQAKDDHAATSEGREVMIEIAANDSGQSLQIDGFTPGETNGDIVCEAGIKSGRILSCAYTPTQGVTGTDKFEYTVKDANGKTDTAMVYVRVKPAS